jgi:hemoglobin-like flavoprotein
MTPRQIELVQQSFAQVQPIAATAADLFYDRLFTLDPGVRAMFKGDMARQKTLLMAMLAAAVNGLRDLDKLAPVVRQLGARHVGYGVKAEHYPIVGGALLWTLEQGLGEAFTPEVREAWTAAYGLLSDVMQQGASEAASA